MPNLISIEVTPDIAIKIRALAEAGVFAVDTGNVTLNFHEKSLKTIKTELFYYPKLSTEKPMVVSPKVHGIVVA